ncbi:MAG: helical backbone metal receptor, partial [Bacteroidota bacterium]
RQIVGRTKFCVHPQTVVRAITSIGGTKQLHLDRIADLRPDLIIGSKEENLREPVEVLMQSFPVWMSDVKDFETALEMIQQLGVLVGKTAAATDIVTKQRQAIEQLHTKTRRRAAYLIWRKPYMTIGRDTYIHDMLARVGFDNVFGDQTRYPSFTLSALRERQPDVILLSSEPFPFRAKHVAALQLAFPNLPVQLVDGEAFSWYGTRLLKTVEQLAAYQKLLV